MEPKVIEPDVIYTAEEVADRIGVDKRSLYEAFENGVIIAQQIGKGWKVLGSNLLDFLKTLSAERIEGNLGGVIYNFRIIRREFYWKLGTEVFLYDMRDKSKVRSKKRTVGTTGILENKFIDKPIAISLGRRIAENMINDFIGDEN